MNKESVVEKLKDALVPSALGGAVSVGSYYFLVDNDLSRPLPFVGTSVPTWAAIGVSSAIGGLAGSVLTEFILPYIPQNSMFAKAEDLVIPPTMAGIGSVVAMKGLIDSRVAIWPSFLVGATGEIGGQYIYHTMYH